MASLLPIQNTTNDPGEKARRCFGCFVRGPKFLEMLGLWSLHFQKAPTGTPSPRRSSVLDENDVVPIPESHVVKSRMSDVTQIEQHEKAILGGRCGLHELQDRAKTSILRSSFGQGIGIPRFVKEKRPEVVART